MTPYFYKIPMGRRNGEDVSGLEAELKEKLAKLNEVGNVFESPSFFIITSLPLLPPNVILQLVKAKMFNHRTLLTRRPSSLAVIP